MDPMAYQQWWHLHLRVARGELLRPEEQSAYDAGRLELAQSEQTAELAAAKQAREELLALDAERDCLAKRRQQLDAEIATLESRLNDPARHFLGVKG